MERYISIQESYKIYKFNNYLIEYTYRIGKDVDLLFNRFVKKELNNIKKGVFSDKLKKCFIDDTNYIFNTINTNILKTKESIQANSIKPATIKFGVSSYYNESFYDPYKNLIFISFNPSVIGYMIRNSYSIKDLQKNIRMKNELDDSRVKGSIYHELSHWLSDNLHNGHIENFLDKYSNTKEKSSFENTYFEIDGLVHAIKQIKRNHSDEWNILTLKSLGDYLPSFLNSALNIYKYKGDKEFINWQKELIKRLKRENLLGKNMNKFLVIRDLL